MRSVSLSTCGLVPKICGGLPQEGLPVTLSLSLHAPNDEVRKKLMPVANAYRHRATCWTPAAITSKRPGGA